MPRTVPPISSELRALVVERLGAALAAAYVRQESAKDLKQDAREEPREEVMQSR
jgi:hypothetical protein